MEIENPPTGGVDNRHVGSGPGNDSAPNSDWVLPVSIVFTVIFILILMCCLINCIRRRKQRGQVIGYNPEQPRIVQGHITNVTISNNQSQYPWNQPPYPVQPGYVIHQPNGYQGYNIQPNNFPYGHQQNNPSSHGNLQATDVIFVQSGNLNNSGNQNGGDSRPYPPAYDSIFSK